MNPWFGKALMLIGILSTVIIRGPHGGRSRKVPVVESRKGPLEIVLLALMWIAAIILPLVAIFTPLLAFADYPLHPLAFAIGAVALCPGIWLFYRSHADLGKNWSVSLEIREDHQLITSGVYRLIRHPMYAAIFLLALAQTLLLSNWLAGPACLLALLLMFVLRIGREERMMLEKFGGAYTDYMNRTNRLIPHLW
ncbi:MAG: protein-S-isoprenylcysteine O-methyltransferase [Steroidobacteraceae bacterium]